MPDPRLRPQQAPPLWALPVAVALALSWMLFELPSFYQRQQWKDGGWMRYVRVRLAAAQRSGADSSGTIVALGTSVMRQALRAEAMTDARGRSYRVVRLTRESRDWDPAPIVAECLQVKPSVLLIEVNLLYLRQGPEMLFAYPWWGGVTRNLPRSDEGYLQIYGAREVRPYDDHATSTADLRAEVVQMDGQFRAPDDSLAPVLEKASRESVVAVLVDLMPRRRDWPVLSRDQLRKMDSGLDALARRTGAHVLRCPFEDEDYVTLGHLSATGSARFEACLREHLAEWLPQ